MAYFKYVPFLFLAMAVFFVYLAFESYNANEDGLPYILLAVASVGYFFIRRRLYRRYQKRDN